MRTDRVIWGFDWFFGLPEDWDEFDKAGAFSTGGVVPQLPDNCRAVVGLIQHTLPRWLRGHGGEVAFVHFDLDIYSATSFALMALKDRFAHGCILLFDEMVWKQRNLDNEGKAFMEFIECTNYCAEYLGQLYNAGNRETMIFRLLRL